MELYRRFAPGFRDVYAGGRQAFKSFEEGDLYGMYRGGKRMAQGVNEVNAKLPPGARGLYADLVDHYNKRAAAAPSSKRKRDWSNYTRPSAGKTARQRIAGPAPSGRRKRFIGKYRYVGRFKRPRRMRAGKFAKHGVSLRVEAAGNVSQDKCVYIGHTTGAAAKMKKVAMQALVRKLAMRLGYKPTSIDDQVDSAAGFVPIAVDIRYSSKEEGNDSTISGVTGLTTGQTWANVSTQIENRISTIFNTGSRSLRIHEIIMKRLTQEAVATVADTAIANCNGMKLTFMVTSSLRIQNRTRAHTEAGLESAAAAQSANNVENNPIIGKSYFVKGNGFRLKNNYDATNTFSLYGNVNTGVIGTQDIDTSGLSAEQVSILSRPPSRHSFLGKVAEGKALLQPGEIKGSFISYKKTMSFNVFWRTILLTLDSASEREYIWCAKSKMFAFEKMMHTDDVEEPDIDIGYECNTLYRASVYEKRQLFGVQHENA